MLKSNISNESSGVFALAQRDNLFFQTADSGLLKGLSGKLKQDAGQPA
jgi:hypothetical protein